MIWLSKAKAWLGALYSQDLEYLKDNTADKINLEELLRRTKWNSYHIFLSSYKDKHIFIYGKEQGQEVNDKLGTIWYITFNNYGKISKAEVFYKW